MLLDLPADVGQANAARAALQELCDRVFAGPGDSVSFLSLKGAFGTARWLVERPIKKARGTGDALQDG